MFETFFVSDKFMLVIISLIWILECKKSLIKEYIRCDPCPTNELGNGKICLHDVHGLGPNILQKAGTRLL